MYETNAYRQHSIKRMGGYEYIAHDPYYDGRVYLRGHFGIYAVDLRKPTDPVTHPQLHGFWTGANTV